jgi:transcriptional regulator of acetoin/glycerol metabolism
MSADLPGGLQEVFPGAVHLPPLRERLQDLEEIVRHVLLRLGGGRNLRCSSDTMRILVRGRWTRNVTELLEVLTVAVRNCGNGEIRPEHVPAQCRAVGRRMLTPLESLERDALIDALAQAGGDKMRAATHLGLSRATIYRKIKRYGIDLLHPGD